MCRFEHVRMLIIFFQRNTLIHQCGAVSGYTPGGVWYHCSSVVQIKSNRRKTPHKYTPIISIALFSETICRSLARPPVFDAASPRSHVPRRGEDYTPWRSVRSVRRTAASLSLCGRDLAGSLFSVGTTGFRRASSEATANGSGRIRDGDGVRSPQSYTYAPIAILESWQLS